MRLWFNKSGLDLKKCGLTKYQLWCVGLCGILTELNGTNHYVLEFEKMTQCNIDQRKEGLQEWWGIYNRNDLLESLHWLEESGHNALFEDLVELFEENPEMTDAELEKLCEEDEDLTFNKLDCVRKHYPMVGDHFIKAWDYGRYIFLCRAGYSCKYLTREETLTLIEGMGRRVKAEFHSWLEFGTNYCIGRRFWASDDPEEEIEMYRTAHEAFSALMTEGGAWTKILWEWSN